MESFAGERVDRSNSRFQAAGCNIHGSHNIIDATGCTVFGDYNVVSGTGNNVIGTGNRASGVGNSVSGGVSQGVSKRTATRAPCVSPFGSSFYQVGTVVGNGSYHSMVSPGSFRNVQVCSSFGGPNIVINGEGNTVDGAVPELAGTDETGAQIFRFKRAVDKFDAKIDKLAAGLPPPPSPPSVQELTPESRKMLYGSGDKALIGSDTSVWSVAISTEDTKAAAERENEACIVCLENRRLYTLQCGHFCMCGKCTKALLKDKVPTCPVCRVVITQPPLKTFQ